MELMTDLCWVLTIKFDPVQEVFLPYQNWFHKVQEVLVFYLIRTGFTKFRKSFTLLELVSQSLGSLLPYQNWFHKVQEVFYLIRTGFTKFRKSFTLLELVSQSLGSLLPYQNWFDKVQEVFYLIRTGFTLRESISLVKVFIDYLDWNGFLGVQRVWTLRIGR